MGERYREGGDREERVSKTNLTGDKKAVEKDGVTAESGNAKKRPGFGKRVGEPRPLLARLWTFWGHRGSSKWLAGQAPRPPGPRVSS